MFLICDSLVIFCPFYWKASSNVYVCIALGYRQPTGNWNPELGRQIWTLDLL